MRLYIRLENGQPIEHPILYENLQDVFPDHDFSVPPEGYAEFIRHEKPFPGVYEIVPDEPVYKWIDGKVQDVWETRAMTEEEKISKQNKVKKWWSIFGSPSWTFDEDTCDFLPPIPFPENIKDHRWKESTREWVSCPPMPTDGKTYIFDVENSQKWIEVPPPPMGTGQQYYWDWNNSQWLLVTVDLD